LKYRFGDRVVPLESLELIDGPFKEQIELDKEEYEKLPVWMKSNIHDTSSNH
jgi:hypothetical protein